MCHQCSQVPLSLHSLQNLVVKQLLLSFNPVKNNHIVKGVSGTWVTFLQISTTWLRTVRLDELPASSFHSPHLFLPEKLSIQGTVQAVLCLGELSPHLNDTAQHHKLNKSWGRDMKNYFQNTHKLFQWLAPLHIQTPAYLSKQNWPGTEVLLHQPLHPSSSAATF